MEALKTWFCQFEELVDLYKIKPEDMWDMDEKHYCLGVTDKKRTIGGTCTKYSLKKSPGSREWVSSMKTVSVERKKLPPLVIFTGKSCQLTWLPTKDNSNYHYTTSDNAWTSDDISLKWLQ